jgi:putative heme transporter
MADELAAPVPHAGRNLAAVLRYVIGILVGFVVLVLLLRRRGEFAAAWHELGTASLGWVAAAIGAESVSLLSFAALQRLTLRLSGSVIPLPGLFALSLANDAIAATVPGEPAVSSAYRYRYYRRRGASGASAGWTIFTVLIGQAIGMALLLLVGVLVALAGSTSAVGAGVTAAGLIIVVAAGAVLVRRDLVLQLAAGLVRAARRVTGHPRGSIGERIEGALARMREIPLSRRSTAAVVAIAFAVWGCDFCCLVCSFHAVHAAIPWHGVLLAYGVAQVAGSFPLIPGGFGIVEGSLSVVLIAYGVGRVPAVAAVLAFRVVNFWLAIAAGWATAGMIALHLRRLARTARPVGAPQQQ